jgi:ABC-type Na+ transport system ATPase subunit NatA
MIHEGKILAEGSWDDFKQETNMHDLDDIFIHFVNKTREADNEPQ